MTTTPVLCGALALLAALPACGEAARPARDEPQAQESITTQVVGEQRLAVVDTVVVPSLSEETAWFQAPHAIHASSSPDHLWAIDRGHAALTHFSLDGSSAETFGRQGEGPEELQVPWTLADAGSVILVLDPPGMRIGAFSREGVFDSEIPLEAVAADFAVREPDELLVVPGKERLVDVYSMEGSYRGGIGPERGDSISCRRCEIDVMPAGRWLVAEPSTPRLFVFDEENDRLTTIDLRNDVMVEWQRSRADGLERSGPGGARVSRILKLWIGELVSVTEEGALLLMLGPYPTRDGTELWRVDMRSGSIIRQPFSGKFVVSAVAVDEDLYALLGEFGAPLGASRSSTSGGLPTILRFAIQ